MLQIEPTVTGALALVTAIGCAFAYFGYDLAAPLLKWIGWIAGAVLGGTIGWVVVPQAANAAVQSEQRLLYAVVFLFLGALLGRALIPLVSRFVAGIAGFAATSVATIVTMSGEQILNAVATARPTAAPLPEQIAAVLNALASLPMFEQQAFQRLLLIAGVVGLIGALLAWRYYEPLVGVTMTVLGAGLLSVAIPLWRRTLAGDPAVAEEFSRSSPLAFGAVLLTGLAFQFVRHSDRDDGSIGGEKDPFGK
ncbi:hypothetical protein ACFQDG_02035 [Natronoarchaeum mannanilyticum]|uniref:DUF368 domain-containing protein n=1 Tax=Natronoarchaeum mannanilyticum TaxID=926360 RepID=A0AAV3T835_9EURY